MSEQNLTIDTFLDKLQSAIYEKDFKELINLYETNKTEMDILFEREIDNDRVKKIISQFLFNISSNDTETIQKTMHFLQILNQNYPNLKLFKEIFKYCCFENPPYTKRPFNIAKLIFPFVENDDFVIFQEAFKICCIYGKNMEMAKWIYEQKPSIEEPTAHYCDNIFEETFEDEQITLPFMKFIYELKPDKISKNSFENVFSYKCDYIEPYKECQNNKIEILQWLYKTKPDMSDYEIQNAFKQCVKIDDYKTAYEIYKMKPTLQIIMDDDDADNDDDDKFEKEEKLKFIQLLFKMNKNYFEN
jgi:hypothetical protein